MNLTLQRLESKLVESKVKSQLETHLVDDRESTEASCSYPRGFTDLLLRSSWRETPKL